MDEATTPSDSRHATQGKSLQAFETAVFQVSVTGVTHGVPGDATQRRTVNRWHARVPTASTTQASWRPVTGCHQPSSTEAVFTVNE